jgi:hypothetical protein
MTLTETLASIRCVTNARGEKTEVLVPLPIWKALLESWRQLEERVENEEDQAILTEWLERQARGEAETVTLDELQQQMARRSIQRKIALGLEYARRGELLDGEAVFDELDRQDEV